MDRLLEVPAGPERDARLAVLRARFADESPWWLPDAAEGRLIERLLGGMRQVTDNVAHDLRSPLNRIRNQLEVTLLESRDEADYRAAIETAVQEADGLIRTFNALLSIAQAEAGVRRNSWHDVDLSALGEDLAELYGAVAEEQGLEFRSELASDLHIQGNRELLAQAVDLVAAATLIGAVVAVAAFGWAARWAGPPVRATRTVGWLVLVTTSVKLLGGTILWLWAPGVVPVTTATLGVATLILLTTAWLALQAARCVTIGSACRA